MHPGPLPNVPPLARSGRAWKEHLLRSRSNLAMRHFPRGEPVEREGMGARCRELLAPGLGCAASTMATEGSAAAAVSQAATELLSEPRASEHQGGGDLIS